jgi:hypothetical protein
MNYKDKQDWMKAVMASDLTTATKVYAYGIHQHMYGNKENSWPGAKALEEVTGLSRSKFYKYNQALEEAGFLEVTHRRGTSNQYRLVEVTPIGSKGSSQRDEGLLPEGVGVTPTGSTKKTKKTTRKITMEDNNTTDAPVVADAPTAPSSLNSELGEGSRYSFKFRNDPDLSKLRGPDPVYVMDLGIEEANEVTPTGSNPEDKDFEARTVEDWRGIEKQRPLTREEREFKAAKAAKYNAQKRAEEEDKRNDVW